MVELTVTREEFEQLKSDFSKLKKDCNKKTKDPNAPKRAASPYNIFIGKAITTLQETEPGLNHKERFTKAVSMWNEQKEVKPTPKTKKK